MGRTLSESVRVIASSPRSSMAGSDSGLPGAPAVRACMRESRVRAPCGGTDDGMDRARRQPTAPNGQGRQRMVTAAYYGFMWRTAAHHGCPVRGWVCWVSCRCRIGWKCASEAARVRLG